MELDGNREIDKTIGIVAYMTLIGWIIAIVMNGEKKDEERAYNAFHLRQMLGLFITGIAAGIAMSILIFIMPFLGILLYLLIVGSMLAFWIIAVIGAANGEKKEIPIVGGLYQNMFGKAFE